ncbi:HesA/MoeB/ThiF family protein [Methanofollis tationis]|uniref:HesA/MoeB/ThiF family protein n=1 Tax=Methanofollis tationis TaxID=81417 RepID=A0A7K4HPQ9_9EURY|nr:HesA/MoeB/ThiF family protein [Methanofollis tationis]NVO66890.1 HesA/MoeB/ThiF family protein [Methanofollis tationis]
MTAQSANERFLRQLPLIGEDGQDKLKNARVLVAGVGGLGSALATYLAAAGVGYIRIVDEDRVEASNMNRQILYREQDIGACKVEAAQQSIHAFSPDTQVDAVYRHIDETSVKDLVQGIDLILDGMDNFAARYILNRAGLDHKIPFVHGAVNGFYGQVTTFLPGATPCLRCLVPTPPEWEKNPIIGVTCGAIGCIEGTEAIKLLTGTGELLKSRLLLWDGLRGDAEVIRIVRSPTCIDCGSSAIELDVSGSRV